MRYNTIEIYYKLICFILEKAFLIGVMFVAVILLVVVISYLIYCIWEERRK